MQLTAKLWDKHRVAWPQLKPDTRHASLDGLADLPECSEQARSAVQQRALHRKQAQQVRSYIKWKQDKVDDWLTELKHGTQVPTEEQLAFLTSALASV